MLLQPRLKKVIVTFVLPICVGFSFTQHVYRMVLFGGRGGGSLALPHAMGLVG